MNPISPQTKKKAKVPSKFNKVIIFGKTKEINKEATQLTKVAKLTPFSGKVSDKYTHKIGPKETPKLKTNSKITYLLRNARGVGFKTTRTHNEITQNKSPYIIAFILPKWSMNLPEIIAVRVRMTPIKKVKIIAMVSFPSCLKIWFE